MSEEKALLNESARAITTNRLGAATGIALNIIGAPTAAPTPAPVEKGPCKTMEEITKYPKSDITFLAKGAYGSVFKVANDYIVKLIDIQNPTIRNAAFREAKGWNTLSKRPEVAIFLPDFCYTAFYRNGLYIVQRYEEVETLLDFLNRYNTSGSLPFEMGWPLFQNLIEGVFRMIEAGYIHRDLKPQNILIRKGGPKEAIPILIDFGFLCALPCGERGYAGTKNYMPPNWFARAKREQYGIMMSKPAATNTRAQWSKAPTGEWQRSMVPNTRTLKGTFIKLQNTVAIPKNTTIKKLKMGPAMIPKYSKYSDGYALAIILDHLLQRIDFTGHDKEGDMAENTVYELMNQTLGGLAAQAAQEKASPPAEEDLPTPPNLKDTHGSFFKLTSPARPNRTKRAKINSG
jgi:serine/threonine protein kinase